MTKSLTNTLIANDFPSFVRECHKICRGDETLNNDAYLPLAFAMAEDIATGKEQRAIINLPPGTGKSFIFAICLPAWRLAHAPSATVLIVEHSKKFAKDTTRNIRKIMQSEVYRRNFRTRIDESWNGAGDFGTTKGGSVFATSVRGAITGYRADLIVVDDPLPIKKAEKLAEIRFVNETFDDEIASRIRNENSCIVVVMHRLHEDDLTAHLTKEGGYKVLAVPLVVEKPTTYISRYGMWNREKREQIRVGQYTKKELRDLAFRPSFRFLYQQGKGGGASLRVKPKHFSFFEHRPNKSLPFVFSIDTAQKANTNSSRMAIQVWQFDGFNHFLVDVFSAKCDYVGLWTALKIFIKRYPPALILIEDTASGSALISQARSRLPYVVKGVVPKGTKFDRFRQHFNLIKQGRIHLPEGADWATDWIDEIVAFPNGEYDDQVDALSMYLDFMATRPRLSPIKPGGGGGAVAIIGGLTQTISGGQGLSTRGHGAVALGSQMAPSIFYPAHNGRPSLEVARPVQIETPLGSVIIRRT